MTNTKKIRLDDLLPDQIERIKKAIDSQMIFAKIGAAPEGDLLFTIWCRLCEANRQLDCTFEEFSQFVEIIYHPLYIPKITIP